MRLFYTYLVVMTLVPDILLFIFHLVRIQKGPIFFLEEGFSWVFGVSCYFRKRQVVPFLYKYEYMETTVMQARMSKICHLGHTHRPDFLPSLRGLSMSLKEQKVLFIHWPTKLQRSEGGPPYPGICFSKNAILTNRFRIRLRNEENVVGVGYIKRKSDI
jgi:hypothetical protein